jgi:hypothetical protein
VRVCVSFENQIPFIGRKGVPTQNVMAACSFDMQFTFVWAGWEGSAHDTRIFLEAIDNPRIKFPKPPEGSNTCLCVSVYMISNVILFFCFCNFQFKTIICFSREILLG